MGDAMAPNEHFQFTGLQRRFMFLMLMDKWVDTPALRHSYFHDAEFHAAMCKKVYATIQFMEDLMRGGYTEAEISNGQTDREPEVTDTVIEGWVPPAENKCPVPEVCAARSCQNLCEAENIMKDFIKGLILDEIIFGGLDDEV